MTAVDDATLENAHSTTLVHTSSSVDVGFNGLTKNVAVNITDNEMPPGLITSPASINVDETGSTSQSLSVKLQSMPSPM